MRRVILMRHGKSKWPADGPPDEKRPLAKRGKRMAKEMGRLLLERGMRPDLVLTSPALRARESAQRAVDEWPGETHCIVAEALYGQGLDSLLATVSALPDSARSALLVGHNPALEELVALLTGEHAVLKTAAAAVVDLAIESWREAAGEPRGALVDILRPQESSGSARTVK